MKPIKTLLVFASAATLALGLASLGATGMTHVHSHFGMANFGMMYLAQSPPCGCCDVSLALAREEGCDINDPAARYDVMDFGRDDFCPAVL